MEKELARAYEGTALLEIMESAVNYNAFLFDLVTRWAPAGATILDFGAGLGSFARRMLQMGHDVRCLEPDATLRHQINESGLVVYTSLGDVAPASMDYIYILNVLEHVEDDFGLLRQLRDRLQPGGRLLIYVPAFEELYSTFDKAVGISAAIGETRSPPVSVARASASRRRDIMIASATSRHLLLKSSGVAAERSGRAELCSTIATYFRSAGSP